MSPLNANSSLNANSPRAAVSGLSNKKQAYRVSQLEIVEMAWEALWSNKLRSGLTMLGVIIGIGSVISITSIGQGIQKSTEESIRGLGTDI